MSTLALSDVIRNVRDLPSLPVVVMDVLRSFEQKDANIGLLADKMAQDQALAAKTLRLANSSFYGLQRKVSTIGQAITILGFDSVRTLVAAAAVTDRFRCPRDGAFDARTFWRHASGVALCAKMLARQLGLNQDYAFVSGLLHDIGKLVLVSRFPCEYEAALAHRQAHDCLAIEAERAVLGLDHTTVGRALAEHWKFPLTMQKAIANHHAPEEADIGDLPALVHVADAIAHALDLSHDDDDLVPVLDERAWKSMNLGADAFTRTCRDVEAEFEEACQILTS
jgi:putative nucleotidyltransferase with HDIG domain